MQNIRDITVDLTIQASYCNTWPRLVLEANDEEVWNNFVAEKTVISVQFASQQINKLRIKYINKNNGPDVWDTKIDDTGRIIEDQHAILTGIMINRARCDWVIPELYWHYKDGTKKQSYGFMDMQGHMDVEFPQDVYSWVIQQRQSLSPTSTKTSALDYKNIYIAQHENQISINLIKEIQQKLHNLDV